ncbi:MAG: hypothetical protein QOD98_1364, partial [Nocardioidaceae bacterium]|nr:hypothetical protein [Nocardioidaceae bacterium]
MALFARERELDAVNALFGRPGAGGTLVLRGEAGVGKSALMDAAISSARRRDARILTTAGVSSQMQQPFAALSHLTRPLLEGPLSTNHSQEASEVVRTAVAGLEPPADRPFSVAYAV